MIIQTDEEGKKALTVVCDLLSKFAGEQLIRGGLATRKGSEKILQTVGVVLDSLKPLPKKRDKKKK